MCVGRGGQLLRRNAKRLRGVLVLKAHRLCVSFNSRLESNIEEEEEGRGGPERRYHRGTRRASEGSRTTHALVYRSPEQNEKVLMDLKDVELKAKARIWP